MFIHSKTGTKHYSIREKINHYNAIISGKKQGSALQKRKAKIRLSSLKKLESRKFEEPTLIVTNDYHFGNKINKPRLCVSIDQDCKGRILVAPITKRTSKTVILDKDNERQIGDKRKWIDKSEIYETKYISGIKGLTRYDKNKVNNILKK